MKSVELRIRTPEGITFAYPLAGPVTRCLAWAVDFIVVIGIVMTTSMGGCFSSAFISPDITGALLMIELLVLPVAYGVGCEWFGRGQTLGKKVFRLRVMDADGLRLQFHQVLMRNLVRFVDQLPLCYVIGGISCLVSGKAQRLGDLAAGTIVVHHRKPLEPDLEQLLGTKFNSLRSHLHLCARIRQRTSADEARLALQALVRRDEFEPAARIKLFAEIAEHFRAKTEFPGELIEAMPDEQFVRSIVDILFRTNAARERSQSPAPEAVVTR